jgi:hypothetical protein
MNLFTKKAKKVKLELVKEVTLDHDGWYTHFSIRKDGSYVLRSYTTSKLQAESYFNAIIAESGIVKKEEVLRTEYISESNTGNKKG